MQVLINRTHVNKKQQELHRKFTRFISYDIHDFVLNTNSGATLRNNVSKGKTVI